VNKYTFKRPTPYTREETFAFKYQWDGIKKHSISGYSVKYVIQDDVYEFDVDLSEKAYNLLCEKFPDFKNEAIKS
jgi:hypothetical protein